MEKLPEVETAKALMTEAVSWSVMRWLREKKRVRKAADQANAALDQLSAAIQQSWPDRVRTAYAAHGPAKWKNRRRAWPAEAIARERPRGDAHRQETQGNRRRSLPRQDGRRRDLRRSRKTTEHRPRARGMSKSDPFLGVARKGDSQSGSRHSPEVTNPGRSPL